MSADYAFTVQITASPTLTEPGLDRLADAVDAADLPGAIHDTVIEALQRTLPKDDQGDERREPVPPMDWYTLRISVA
jgi:hypothetical protein